MWDTVVIGGGIIGASLAYHLAKSGAKTHLIDRHDAGRATYAGAGILSPESSSKSSEDWYRFGVKAVSYYPELVKNLTAEQNGDIGYAMCGALRVAINDDELAPFEQTRQLIAQRQTHYGAPTSDDLYDITPKQAQTIFPALASPQKALFHRTGARVDGKLLCEALINAGKQHGLEVQNATVDSLILEGQRVVGVISDGEEIRAGSVAIAGGAWSPHFGEQLGVYIPVAPQRGQIIHLQLDGVDTAGWSIVSAFHGHYIVARENGRIIVGATRETGSGFKPQTTASGVQMVLDEALRVAPGLADAQVIEIRVGLRPYSADTLPVLGTVPNMDGVYLATGHGPTGLQLGPYSSKLIADMMLGAVVSDDLTPFHIRRFITH